MRQTCSKCKRRFFRSHRWHRRYHRFLFWTWTTREHFNCRQPELGPVKRLKGEVPLPFPGPLPDADVIGHGV
jgi:hypothetical protein